MDPRRLFTAPPNPSSDANMYNYEHVDDNQYGVSEAMNTSFDYNDFINADYTSSPMSTNAQLAFGSPAAFGLQKQEHTHSPLPHIQPRSAVSSTSPDSSIQDSSSDSSGRRKRKSPSSSSPTAMFGSQSSHEAGNWTGVDGMDIDRKRRLKHDSPVLPIDDMNLGITSMTESFQINSAGNSPPGLAPTPPTSQWGNSANGSLAGQDAKHIPSQGRSTATFSFGPGSRDDTPPSALFETPTPFMTMRDSPDVEGLPFPARNNFADMNTFSTMFTPSPLQTVGANTIHPTEIGRARVKLHVSPLGNKSRVETQIPIKLTLDPLPAGIKKMHLPTETIAKAKFLAKENPKMPDTLELSAMLICTSAMEKPENKFRALQIARDGLTTGDKSRRRSSTGDTKKGVEVDPNDPDAPVNGGPVMICDNCVSRERKRAGRKKAKKQEDEERWYEFERDRIIMFNTQEYLDFHPPTPAKEQQYYDPTGFSPEALQVDAPMRIVCYCRHQQEKIGFQVIFTVKDFQGQVIAQVMTQSILITDDHKTHTQGMGSTGSLPGENGQYSMPQFIGSASAIQPQGLPGRAYHSSTNLAAMSQPGFWGNVSNATPLSHTPTTSMTPRNLSRPASPSGHTGPKKKRKGSGGQHKLPAGLQMTRADLQPLSIPPGTPVPSMNPLTSPENGTSAFDPASQFGHMTAQGHFNTNPPTPSTNIPPTTRDGGADSSSYFYSAPNSAHQSRAASPVSFARMSTFTPQHSQLSTSQSSAFTSLQFSPDEQQHVSPLIYKVRPERGPVSGNVEVVVLGKNFHRNLEVMFGENTATTTTFWNSDTLVCLLPPSLRSGPVPVTFFDPTRPGYAPPPTSQSPIFTYIDDTKQQLFELAIQLQCTAQMGPGADHWSYAQSVLASHGNAGGFGSGQTSGFGGNVLNTSSAEELIMTMINKIDLIDSVYKPYFDLQQTNGATMLSLACSLGYEKLVAGLLARGAHPDVKDAGGFTPLMFAAMHGHTAIVRRLILRGADSNLRTLSGRTAAELARSSEVASSLRHVRHHFRSVSAGTPYFRSRANSAASTRSLWGPPSSGASSTMFSTDDESAIDSSDEDVVEEAPRQMLSSRRPSATPHRSRRNSNTLDPQDAPVLAPNPAYPSYIVAQLAALRDQLTAQINQFPQLPNMEFWQDQNLPAIGRRISAFVPNLGAAADPATSDPPPAYYEACPDGVDNDFDTKPPELFTAIAETSCSASVATIRPGSVTVVESTVSRQRTLAPRGVTIGKTSPTIDQAAQLRRLRQEELTPAKHDAKLWSIWFPLLIVLVTWWSFGLKLPPAANWLRSVGDRVTDAVTATVTTAVAPAVPTRLREILT